MRSQLSRITEGEWRTQARVAQYRVEALANVCGISLRTLERHFCEVMGKSPQAWLNHERMRVAQELLLDATSVKETASELGYQHAQHFSRAYKKHFGHSPARLRLKFHSQSFQRS